jgi:hypothetical protein
VQRIAGAIESGLERRAEHRKYVSNHSILPGYESLFPAVRRFREDHPYESSVFVMMKFADPQMDESQRQLLNDIWRVVSDTLDQRRLKARRADLGTYHDRLWENVCVHMLGSRYGMAILEDHVAPEMDPNVTLEYGFMKALNRRAGLFRAEDFGHDRLLPIFPCYDPGNGRLVRVAEVDEISNVDRERARAALAFHRVIEAAVQRNSQTEESYRTAGYRV